MLTLTLGTSYVPGHPLHCYIGSSQKPHAEDISTRPALQTRKPRFREVPEPLWNQRLGPQLTDHLNAESDWQPRPPPDRRGGPHKTLGARVTWGSAPCNQRPHLRATGPSTGEHSRGYLRPCNLFHELVSTKGNRQMEMLGWQGHGHLALTQGCDCARPQGPKEGSFIPSWEESGRASWRKRPPC